MDMADLDDIYNLKILELAADIPHSARLAHPDASASAHSKLCGSTIEIDLKLKGTEISEFGQTVKACLLGQAAAAIVGREIVGTTVEEFRQVDQCMRAMLKEEGPPPEGRWADLALLEPVRPYKSRHASTLLVFEAIAKAIAAHRARDEMGAAANA